MGNQTANGFNIRNKTADDTFSKSGYKSSDVSNMNKTQFNSSSQTLMIEIHVLDKAPKGSSSED